MPYGTEYDPGLRAYPDTDDVPARPPTPPAAVVTWQDLRERRWAAASATGGEAAAAVTAAYERKAAAIQAKVDANLAQIAYLEAEERADELAVEAERAAAEEAAREAAAQPRAMAQAAARRAAEAAQEVMCDLTNSVSGVYRAEGEQLVPSEAVLRSWLGPADAMQLTGFAREMAVFLYGVNQRHQRVVKGTGFLVNEWMPGIPGGSYWQYLVTARHVIEEIRRISSDDIVHVRANSRLTDSAEWYDVPLAAWQFHPDDLPADIKGDDWRRYADEHPEDGERRRYDVAVASCPANLIETGAVTSWPNHLILSDQDVIGEGINQGDDLAIIGLYHRHVGNNRVTPIVRAGMIAAMPSDDLIFTELGAMRAYLIEARSTGGLSGSPVIRLSHPAPEVQYRPVGFGPDSELKVTTNVTYRVLGLVSGHFDAVSVREEERVNEGIAVVVPAEDILVTMRQDALMQERQEQYRQARASSSQLARLDSFNDEDAETAEQERVALPGVSPEDALRALLKTPPTQAN